MKFRLLFACVFIGQIVSGQAGAHIKVTGTKCSIIPPDGFKAASAFSGFQDTVTGASILVNEIPAPYQSIIDGFTVDVFKARGMALISKQTVDFHHLIATLFHVRQPANGMVYIKQMLVFGDEKQTILVNGIYPEASKSLEAKIKEALLSTVYTVSQDNNPLEAVTFAVDVERTDLKLVKYLSGSLLYSVDGQVPTGKPTLIVGNSIAKVPFQDQKKYAEERLKKLPGGENSIIKHANEITIDHLKGYEIIADNKTKDNKSEVIYQVMLFNNNGDYYIIVGQTKEDFSKYIATFRRVARSFKRK